MTTYITRVLTLLAVILSCTFVAAVRAEEVADLGDIYTRLEAIESSLAISHASTSGTVSDGEECCDCCRAGLIGGGEVVWLKAYNPDGFYEAFNWDEGFRAWLGYQRSDGLGVRARYFDFDQVADNNDLFLAIHTDLEIFDTVEVGCNWDVVIGAGARYVEINFDEASGTSTERFYGVGPVVTAEVYRHVNHLSALYVIGRQSILVGDEGRFENQPNSSLTISEIQMGAQIHRDWNGALIFGRIGWESQCYYDLLNASNTMATLMGGAVSFGISR